MSVKINGTTGVTTPNLTATTKVTTADLANTGNYNGGQLGNRNLIINGAQTIDQRRNGSSVSIPSVTTVVTDRWNPINRPSAGGLMSGQQVTDSPAGFSNSLKLTVSTADSSLGTSDYYFLWQKIEGFNSAHLSYGTSDAVSTTLSFWVKSSVAGQYSGFIINGAENYSCNIPYTIESAGTWEYKTITFPGAPAGTWIGSTNGKAMMVGFGLANGTGLQSSTTSWQETFKYGSSGDVNWMASSGNTFQVTGIQFEVGDTATPFEHRSYGDELAKCQRYYQKFPNALQLPAYQDGSTGVNASLKLSPNMRSTTPSIANDGSVYLWRHNGFQSQNNPTITPSSISGSNITLIVGGYSGGANGYVANLYISNLEVSNEL